jgi:hypothetical protein
MRRDNDILVEILTAVQTAKKASKNPLVVFDLDSTLFEVESRSLHILKEFSKDVHLSTQYPKAARVFHGLESLPPLYQLKKFLKHLNLESEPHHFYKAVFEHWKDRFFNSEYLKHDTPYEGSVEYVLSLRNSGAEIVYLTGRDEHRMGKGTRKSLIDNGFPLDEVQCRLKLKEHKDIEDSEFKSGWFEAAAKTFDPIWFFENEPVNINKVVTHHPTVKVVYFDSVHSGEQEVFENSAIKIKGFK